MADPDQKTTTIDDLVNQLSRQKSNQADPPSNLPGFRVGGSPTATPVPRPVAPMQPSSAMPAVPKPSVIPPPMPPKPVSPIMPVPPGPKINTPPHLPTAPKPAVPSPMAPPSTVPIAPSPAAPKEYRSSIRTMTEDLASLKAGQKPSGVEIPRTVMPEKPAVPPVSGPMPAPRSAAPVGPRQLVELGKTEKTGTFPTMRSAPKIGASIPSAPTPPPGPKMPQPPISVPEARKGLSPAFYITIVGVLLAGAFLYWFFILKTPSEVALSPTPAPSMTVTPTPVPDLASIFGGTPENFETTSGKDSSGDFKSFVNTLTVDPGSFYPVNIVQAQADGSVTPLTFFDMMSQSLVSYPADIKSNLGHDSIVLVYGQKEAFTSKGQLDLTQTGLKRVAVVSEINNKGAVMAALSTWESTMPVDIGKFLIPAGAKAGSATFLDNNYRNTAIRYKNFPFPDLGIGYFIISASNGKDYLVVASSREAVFAAIDKLSSF